MISKASFSFLVFLFVVLINYYPQVEGKNTSNRIALSKKENGDTFDCIDIHKQPAFDHPLLKNHKIQMRPNSRPKNPSGPKSKYSRGSRDTIFKHLNCREGTVPIRRTKQEDLIRAESFFKSYNPTSTKTQENRNIDGQHFAIRRTKVNEPYYGVHGWINVAGPSILNDQFSAGQLWIEGGPLNKITTLQAGWAVAPELFQDSKPRLFVYSNSDVNPDGCYNLLCQGFVQTDQDIALGQEFKPSKIGGKQHVLAFEIFKAENGGGWWLAIGEPGEEMKNIGYWPDEIYGELVHSASYVAWGGFVRSNRKRESPKMGTGLKPSDLLVSNQSLCKVVHLQVIYSNFTFVPPNESALEDFVDSQICYGLEYNGFYEETGFSFTFGGPGGNDCGNN